MSESPQYCKVFIPDVEVFVFFYKTREKFLRSKGENFFLLQNEVLYRSSYGREVIVDADTMKITYPNLEFYKNRKIIPVTMSEYGNGFKKYANG